jgi:exo-1,4-beta-D-glucosaminidase
MEKDGFKRALVLQVAISILISAIPIKAADSPIFSLNANDWKMQSSVTDTRSGSVISGRTFTPTGWYTVKVPCTVMDGLMQAGYYGAGYDPFYSNNLASVSSTIFNNAWWYRKEFTIPAAENGKRIWLNFKGINYKADIWVNSTQIANNGSIIGTFREYELDITGNVVCDGTTKNVVAVLVPKVNYAADLAIFFVDWNPAPPDANMGIWSDVFLTTSGAVTVRNPHVVSTVDANLAAAHLTVVAEVSNSTASAVSGTVNGTITGPGGTNITFSQGVSLAANEKLKRVTFASGSFSQLNISTPQLWWPWQMGAQNLHTLTLGFTANSTVSDQVSHQFGIRQITSQLMNSTSRKFFVNGKAILIRGAAQCPDLFLRRTTARQQAVAAYIRELNLNTVRLEGKFEDETYFALMDQLGVLIDAGWCCCDRWQESASWTASEKTIAYESLKSQIRRLRIHPCMMLWRNGSDNEPIAEVKTQYESILSDLQWPNVVQASAATDGCKMRGPYEWVPPSYWYTDNANGGAFGFNSETSPGAAPPPLESLQKFIPANKLWPASDIWDYHCNGQSFGGGQFTNLSIFNGALNARYGAGKNLADYCMKSQVASYESHRAEMEAFGRNKYTATGQIQWMLENAWPSMFWHLYDYYLNPCGSYFGTKLACEPLHIQYSYDNKTIVVVNSYYTAYANLTAKVDVYNLDGTNKYTNTVNAINVAADGVTTALTLPTITGLTSAYFLRLELKNGSSTVSVNSYALSTTSDVLNYGANQWFYTPTSSYANLTALQTLPAATLTCTNTITHNGAEDFNDVTVTNTGSGIAFGVYLTIKKGAAGDLILPIRWQDNLFMLLPGETRTVRATYLVTDLGGAVPVITTTCYNNGGVTTAVQGRPIAETHSLSAESMDMKTVTSASQVRFCFPSNAAHSISLCKLSGKTVALHSGYGDWIVPANTLADGVYFFRGHIGNRLISSKLILNN